MRRISCKNIRKAILSKSHIDIFAIALFSLKLVPSIPDFDAFGWILSKSDTYLPSLVSQRSTRISRAALLSVVSDNTFIYTQMPVYWQFAYPVTESSLLHQRPKEDIAEMMISWQACFAEFKDHLPVLHISTERTHRARKCKLWHSSSNLLQLVLDNIEFWDLAIS